MPSSVSSNTTTSSPSYYQVLSQQTTPPKDTYYVVYASFFLAGLAMLIPWNALITAEEYFGRKFGGTPYADNFLNYITLNFTFVNFITLAIIVKYQSRFTLATQIFGALALNIIAFLYFTVTAQFTIGTNEDFFYVTMFLTMMSAVGTSYMQNGMFGISAQFPPIYILAVMSGQGVAGVVVAVSSMISAGINAAENKKLTDEAANLSGFYYFLFGTLVLVISAGFLVLLQKNPFYIYYSTTVQDESVTTSSGATAKSSIEESEESGPDRKVLPRNANRLHH